MLESSYRGGGRGEGMIIYFSCSPKPIINKIQKYKSDYTPTKVSFGIIIKLQICKTEKED